MKGRKIITISIIINLILVGIIYNLISKINVNNKKQVIKEMSETEYEDYITELNQSHEDYANYIEQSKAKIASAITDMGVETSNQETLEIMASNIRKIKSALETSTSLYSDGRYTLNNNESYTCLVDNALDYGAIVVSSTIFTNGDVSSIVQDVSSGNVIVNAVRNCNNQAGNFGLLVIIPTQNTLSITVNCSKNSSTAANISGVLVYGIN